MVPNLAALTMDISELKSTIPPDMEEETKIIVVKKILTKLESAKPAFFHSLLTAKCLQLTWQQCNV